MDGKKTSDKLGEFIDYIHNWIVIFSMAAALLVYAIVSAPFFLIRWICKHDGVLFSLAFVAMIALIGWMMWATNFHFFGHW